MLMIIMVPSFFKDLTGVASYFMFRAHYIQTVYIFIAYNMMMIKMNSFLVYFAMPAAFEAQHNGAVN